MHKIDPLLYDYNALEPFIDTVTMQIHHDKHHQAYVDNLNKVLEGTEYANIDLFDLVSKIDSLPADIKIKVRNNAGGHINHKMFWKLMLPHSDFLNPDGKILEFINSSFGNLDNFKEKFTEKALGRFGSGWVWVIVNEGKLEICDTPNQDTPLMDGKKAILGLDVWEHAYYLKYQNKRVEYVSAWWNVVNWKKVEENLEKAI